MQGKKVAISQSNYIPWKEYFDMINMADEFVFYDGVQYTKRDWRNRNKSTQWTAMAHNPRIYKRKIQQNNHGSKNKWHFIMYFLVNRSIL